MTWNLDRRQFIRLAGLTALTSTIPSFLGKTGRILAGEPHRDTAPLPGLKDNRVLVIVQLAGGNDGLNTLVPYADDSYYKMRPRIGIDAKKVLKLDDHLGLHPEMVELHQLFQEGGLAVVPNVGYPNPARSHFRAMDIWETASPANQMWKTGWVGRYFDAECQGVPGAMLGLRLGEQAALTMAGERTRAATLANPSLLEVPATGALARGLEKINEVEPTGIDALDFIQRTGNETHGLARRLKAVVRDIKPAVDYPPFALVSVVAPGGPDDRGRGADARLLRHPGGLRHPRRAAQSPGGSAAGVEPGARPFPQGPRGAGAPGPRAALDLLGVRTAGRGE